MTGYVIVSVEEIIGQLGERRCQEILSQFSCSLNKDVETFIRDKNKAIEFSKQRIAMTYIVLTSYCGNPVIVGYFTVANKFLLVYKNALSSKMRGRIKKFTTYDIMSKAYKLSSPLIAQIGKNYRNGYNKLITGDELLKMACDKVTEAQSILGGKTVYLECEDCNKLKDFYERNGFVVFGKRLLDRDEKTVFDGEYLLQLLKYFSK